MLSVRVKQHDRELPQIRRSFQRTVTLSSLFPLMLARKIDSLTPGKVWSFSVIYEDDVNRTFSSETGLVFRMEDDAFAKATGTRKVRVEIRSSSGFWYLDSSGYAVRIQTGGTDAILDRVKDEQTAKAALDASPFLKKQPNPSQAAPSKAARDAALDEVLYGE